MNKKRSLGRGLSSLIPDAKDTNHEGRIIKVSLDKIKAREGQPRKTFDQKGLEDLARSIKEYGLLNPISLSKAGDHYEILAGERRYRASLLNGATEIEAIIKDYEDKDIEILSLIENVQREDLSSIEEATAYKKLYETYNLTQDQIAEKMGKSRSYIANTMRLLKLEDSEKEALNKGEISSSQARSLLSLKDEDDRKKALEDYKNKKTVVREVEELSRAKADKPSKEEGPKTIENEKHKGKYLDLSKDTKDTKEEKLPNLDQLLFDDFEEKFMDKLSTKVSIKKDKDTYRLVIDCYSIEDLENIYKRLGEDD
ncbi:ParB/RepB/Spo0J family partition protein [Anaerococcus sp. NML200574]|uniref:ParB/RepB/Spo0J family partition protein n=1 Tax=Anaerococcus sp. NML200574 TaxID=2954486 RepID=UPI00223853A7|nr:ParB/RepB/Spo0J family partition protein [Anaerococcus sp. NML200574]MCW6678508.1 ParB/RepB/Spo0J family partition protein [Anaerococcus sp. NML200574]